jgi:ATP synthase I chain
MTELQAEFVVRRIYWLVLAFGIIGFVAYFTLDGWRPAVGFALGALGSFGNLWLYERLTHLIEPAAPGEPPKKPWQTGVFITRYVVMILLAYAIVNTLGVNALAVILGLLTNSAAVLTSSLIEVFESFFVSRSSH